MLTDFILIELGATLSRPPLRDLFVRLLAAIRSDPNVSILEASRESLDRGLMLFSQRPDKDWSVTDCISFDVMREFAITEALTADHHFEQAGLTILLK